MPRVLAILLFILLSFPASSQEDERLLLIGNSYTFCNDLPGVIQAIANADRYPLEVDSYTAGAMSLRGFLNSPEHSQATRKLASGGYKWVLLQDQSQTPSARPDETLASVRQWTQLARKHSTRPILFLTWAHAAQENNRLVLQAPMQDDTSLTYCRAAVENKIRVAPVGEAWRRWYSKYPTTPLHTNDLSHPTPEGTYLAACVIYCTITGKVATSLPIRLKNSPVHIPAAQARQLQKIAAATLKGFSPAQYLHRHEQKEQQLLSAEDVRAQLTADMSISTLIKLLGKPAFVQKTPQQHSYQFRLRNRTELVAYCTPRGKIRQISIASPTERVQIIDMSQL